MIRKTVAILLASVSLAAVGEDFTHSVSGHSRHKGHHAPKHLDNHPNLMSEDAWMFGVESNVYADTTYIGPSISYSGYNGWDVSIASYNIPVHGGGAQNYEYDTYFGVTKTFKLTRTTNVIVGTQNGSTLFSQVRQWHNMEFVDTRQDITKWLTLHAGPYYANKSLTAVANKVGVMTGFEVKILPDKVHLRGDYMSGHTAVSGAEINLQWYIVPTVQPYIGVIVPEANSGNEFAGVVGFNISTKSLN